MSQEVMLLSKIFKLIKITKRVYYYDNRYRTIFEK